MVADYRPKAIAKGLDLYIDTPPAVQVDAQPELLREVVLNLLDNAVKYTSEGQIQVTVTEGEGEAVMIVEDTGIGMTTDDLAQAADRFYRSAQVSTLDIPGSGLGLSLVAQIVQRHGGTFTVDSAAGEGTRIRLTLPSAPPETLGVDGGHDGRP
jgi:signal transduction histidine kinase